MTRAEYERAVAAFEKVPRGSGPGRLTEDIPVRNIRPCTILTRCGAGCGDDPQSGPIYCDDLAVVVADVADRPGYMMAYCERHRGRMNEHPKAD